MAAGFNLRSAWPWLLAAGGVVAVALVPSRPADAAGATNVTPPALPPTTPVQSRPIPPFDGLGLGQVQDIVRIAQAQLNALGEGPIAVDGLQGPATRAAVARFLADYPPTDDQRAAYESLLDGRATLYELDDVVRLGAGLDPGANPSASLLSPARHRRLV